MIPLDASQLEKIRGLARACHPDNANKSASPLKAAAAESRTQLIEAALGFVRDHYTKIEKQFEDSDRLRTIERTVITRAIDALWMDHLAAMSALRTGIGLQGYGQRDPLVEYKKESYGMFQHLLSSINQEIVYSFFKYADHALRQQSENHSTTTPTLHVAPSKSEKPGRNDLCACGSGQKYKKCHGK